MAKRHSYADAKKRADTHQGGFESTSIRIPEGVKLFKVKREGIHRLDIIPYIVGKGNPFAEEGTLYYERTYYSHRGIGTNEDSYICLNKTFGEPCPICEFRNKLRKQDDADEDQVKDLAPRERQLFHVIDLAEPDKGVQLWDVSFHLFGKLLDAELRNADEGEDYHMFYHLDKGLTLKVGFAEKSFGGNSFYAAETIGFKPRREPYDDDILEKTHNLDELLKAVDYDKLRAILLQDDNSDDKKSTKSRRRTDDDDHDEEEKKSSKSRARDDDDHDEEEKKPAKSSKQSSFRDDDDEEKEKKSSKKPAKDDDWDD